MDLSDLTVGQLRRATAIKERIEALNKELRGILRASADSGAAPKQRRRRAAAKTAIGPGRRKKKVFSAATRAKLSARMKAYWAAKRAGKK